MSNKKAQKSFKKSQNIKEKETKQANPSIENYPKSRR
jgi:hypothetical protein